MYNEPITSQSNTVFAQDIAALDYFDAHVHLDLMPTAGEVARSASSHNFGFFSCGVSPTDFPNTSKTLTGRANQPTAPGIRIGIGAHPWWIADGQVSKADIEMMLDTISDVRFIGEIGLDFSSRFNDAEVRKRQLHAFKSICRKVAQTPADDAPKILSIHAVKSVDAVLDVLEETKALNRCRAILHWFSGSSDQLHRAILAGCWFSVGEKSLKTGKGREYAKVYPADRLLTETDLPSSEHPACSIEDLLAGIERACKGLSQARGYDVQDEVIANAATLFGA